MKKIITLFLTTNLFLMAAIPALAADTAYPHTVTVHEDGEITKTYLLSPDDDPASIPISNFERGGVLYTLADLLKNQNEQAEEMVHTETVTLPSASGDLSEALRLFDPTMDFADEDDYTGTLTLDHTTVKVGADGYKTSSWTVSATRTYPNLSDADLSLVPKSIEDNGRTLTLDDVSWSAANTENVDGYALPERYTATATYTGTASNKKATGWTATADYTGTLTRTVPGSVEYTAVFVAVQVAPSPEPTPEITPEPTIEPPPVPSPAASTDFSAIGEKLFFVVLVAALFGLGIMVSRRNKKRKEGKEG